MAAALRDAAERLHPLGTRIVYLPDTGSTNDVVADLASRGAPEGTVVFADAQRRGRGRSGHSWFSPPMAGLYVSVLLRPAEVVYGAPETPPAWANLLTLAAGVALAEGIETASGLRLDIKWPNDIVSSNRRGPRTADRRLRKIAGILAEGHTVQGVLRHVVIGYGINILSVAYPPDIADRATSLEAELGRAVDRPAVLVETLAALAREYAALKSGGSRSLVARWRDRSPSAVGAAVSWVEAGRELVGVTAGVDDQGSLLVAREGRVVALRAGEVTWR